MLESSTEMRSEVRMIGGGVNQAMSSACIVSCLADLYILYALSIHSLHYVLVSDVGVVYAARSHDVCGAE